MKYVKPRPLGMYALMLLFLVQQIYAMGQARIHRAELIRQTNEIKALVWLAAERSGNQ